MEPADQNLPKWVICMAGAPGVGKSSLVRRFVDNMFSHEFLPTMGVDIRKKTVEVGGQRIILMLWDLAGDDEFLLSSQAGALMQNTRIARAMGFILVADVTRRATLSEAIARHRRIVADAKAGGQPEPPFVLALNKSDVEEREILEAEVRESVPGWTVIPTSAKTGDGVELAFRTIAEIIVSRLDEDDE